MPLSSPSAWPPQSRLRSFWRTSGAASAVEFALVLPVMLTMLIGGAEMAHAIDNWRKVTLLARTVADLTSQGDVKQNPMSSATMSDILASSAMVLRPFTSSSAKIVVSAMSVDATSPLRPRVCSSVATSNATARNTGIATDLTIPPGIGFTGARYVLAEVSMPYTPMMGTALVKFVNGVSNSITLKTSFPWPTRGGTSYNSTYTEVVLPGGVQCP